MFDDAMRAFRSYLPDAATTDDDARAVAQRVIGRARTRTVAPRIRRHGIAVAAASGLAAVGALALVATRVDRQPSLTTPIVVGTPRVDWGMRALVTVTPDPGVSVEDATQRTKELLGERLEKLDVQGAEVSVPKPGQLSLKVPGAETHQQIRGAIWARHIQVFRTDQVIAQGRTIAQLAATLPPVPAGVPSSYLAERSTPTGTGPRWITEHATRRDAQRAAVKGRSSSGPTLKIQRSWVFAQASTAPYPYRILSGAPAIASTALEITPNDESLTLRLPPNHHLSDENVIVVIGDIVGQPARSFSTRITTDRRLEIPGPRSSIPTSRGYEADTETRSLNGIIRFTSFSSFGQRPPMDGTAIPPTAPWMSIALRKGVRTARRVLAATVDDTRLTVDIAFSPGGQGTMYYLLTRRGAAIVSAIRKSEVPSNPCPFGLGAPPISECFTHFSSGGGGANSTIPGSVLAGGRVGPDVARVDAELKSGETIPGQIHHGWFVVATGKRLDNADLRAPVTLRAFDNKGNVIHRGTTRMPPPVPAP